MKKLVTNGKCRYVIIDMCSTRVHYLLYLNITQCTQARIENSHRTLRLLLRAVLWVGCCSIVSATRMFVVVRYSARSASPSSPPPSPPLAATAVITKPSASIAEISSSSSSSSLYELFGRRHEHLAFRPEEVRGYFRDGDMLRLGHGCQGEQLAVNFAPRTVRLYQQACGELFAVELCHFLRKASLENFYVLSVVPLGDSCDFL
mmetsp:Transcript_6800/g.10725  ORF Transcript_6800/g.10725 Transcript_6800/m.10725 type:complete len:204 (-) Transcript_6800:1255-1866(-)